VIFNWLLFFNVSFGQTDLHYPCPVWKRDAFCTEFNTWTKYECLQLSWNKHWALGIVISSE
jgi:hypothetical protein